MKSTAVFGSSLILILFHMNVALASNFVDLDAERMRGVIDTNVSCGGTGRLVQLSFQDECQNPNNCSIRLDRKYSGLLQFEADKAYNGSLTLQIRALDTFQPNRTRNPSATLSTGFYTNDFLAKKSYAVEYGLAFPKSTFYKKSGMYLIQLNLTSEAEQTVICQHFSVNLNGNGAQSVISLSLLYLASIQAFLFISKESIL